MARRHRWRFEGALGGAVARSAPPRSLLLAGVLWVTMSNVNGRQSGDGIGVEPSFLSAPENTDTECYVTSTPPTARREPPMQPATTHQQALEGLPAPTVHRVLVVQTRQVWVDVEADSAAAAVAPGGGWREELDDLTDDDWSVTEHETFSGTVSVV